MTLTVSDTGENLTWKDAAALLRSVIQGLDVLVRLDPESQAQWEAARPRATEALRLIEEQALDEEPPPDAE